MKIRLPLLVAASLLGAAATPAFADCMSDIKSVEPAVAAIDNVAKKDKAQGLISKALEHAQSGDEKACTGLLNQAKKTGGVT